MRLGLKKRQTFARRLLQRPLYRTVVEAYRLDRYDNLYKQKSPHCLLFDNAGIEGLE